VVRSSAASDVYKRQDQYLDTILSAELDADSSFESTATA
jgi:hypothetical protein